MASRLVAIRALALFGASSCALDGSLVKEGFSAIISGVAFKTFAHFAQKLDATSFIVAFIKAV
jgi:hypothetical protein